MYTWCIWGNKVLVFVYYFRMDAKQPKLSLMALVRRASSSVGKIAHYTDRDLAAAQQFSSDGRLTKVTQMLSAIRPTLEADMDGLRRVLVQIQDEARAQQHKIAVLEGRIQELELTEHSFHELMDASESTGESRSRLADATS